MMLEYSAVISTGNQLDSGDYTLEISLRDLIRCGAGDAEDQVLCEGTWAFTVPLAPESQSPAITLASAQVSVYRTGWEDVPETEEEERVPETIPVTDIRITATGVSFYAPVPVDMSSAAAILADGTEVRDNGGGGGRTEDGRWYANYDWPAPLDLDQVTALRIGETEIPLT